MKDLLWEIKYQLKRTLKHIFYVLLAVCFFACWYLIFGLFTNLWDVKEWSDSMFGLYFTLSLTTGFGYLMYRIAT
jgi:hypothetical protein